MGFINTHPNSSCINKLGQSYAAYPYIIIGLIILLILSVILGVGLGPIRIEFSLVWQIILAKLFTLSSSLQPDYTTVQENIVWKIRLPRVLLGALVGAGLSVAGVSMQALVRNNLADPYVLGVSSGASAAATLVILLGVFSGLGQYALSFGAFVGAAIAIFIVYILAHSGGRVRITQLLLSGVALSMIMAALTNLIVMLAPSTMGLRAALFWLMGSLAGARWSHLSLPAIVILLCIIMLMSNYRTMNALVMGEEAATTLGVNVNKFQKLLLLISSLLVGVIVAVSGSIGFVGLMVPHICRLFIGSDHRRVLPASALLGAIFMIWVDVLARLVIAPEELAVGIITALVGGPLFIGLLRSKKEYGGGV